MEDKDKTTLQKILPGIIVITILVITILVIFYSIYYLYNDINTLNTEYTILNTKPVLTPQPGVLSPWSVCDVQCGGGVQIRSYTPPVNGGLDDPNMNNLVQPCNTQPCLQMPISPNPNTTSTPTTAAQEAQQLALPANILAFLTAIESSGQSPSIPAPIPTAGYYTKTNNGPCVVSQTDNTPLLCGTGVQPISNNYIPATNGGSDSLNGTQPPISYIPCNMNPCPIPTLQHQ